MNTILLYEYRINLAWELYKSLKKMETCSTNYIHFTDI